MFKIFTLITILFISQLVLSQTLENNIINWETKRIKLFDCNNEGLTENFPEFKKVNFLRFESCNSNKYNLVSFFHKSIIYAVVICDKKEYKMDCSEDIGRQIFYNNIQDYIKLETKDRLHIDKLNRQQNDEYYLKKIELIKQQKINDSTFFKLEFFVKTIILPKKDENSFCSFLFP
jgi:hypothetical protein